ncbi:hypothetical protein CBOM_07442 [Ceraceosorus bombacis]|uniref:Uncharacterized protein n=1 Tax=Ceraceosorus bombacis TaxID=401625 RepID=A0A0N7L9E6_9BASI|nr:hypothetical protein CBOM_07442 [Ceraceosorus bombacis]
MSVRAYTRPSHHLDRRSRFNATFLKETLSNCQAPSEPCDLSHKGVSGRLSDGNTTSSACRS